jgi:hypothetical protein
MIDVLVSPYSIINTFSIWFSKIPCMKLSFRRFPFGTPVKSNKKMQQPNQSESEFCPKSRTPGENRDDFGKENEEE